LRAGLDRLRDVLLEASSFALLCPATKRSVESGHATNRSSFHAWAPWS